MTWTAAGWADGYHGRGKATPAHSEEAATRYDDGYAAGAEQRARDEARARANARPLTSAVGPTATELHRRTDDFQDAS